MLFACMLLGAMVGSTTCSITLLRWLVVLKAFRRELFTSIHTTAVRPVRINGEPIDEESIRDVYGFVLLSILVSFVLTVFVVIDAARVGLSVSEFEAMSAAASTFLNIGPAFGLAGPYGSCHAFPWTTKVAMTALLLIGRVDDQSGARPLYEGVLAVLIVERLPTREDPPSGERICTQWLLLIPLRRHTGEVDPVSQ